MIETNKLIEEVTKKQEMLARASAELKSHFIGIDSQIDAIISNISTWYIMPNLITRPIIICLFGPTGVGKTDLVRRLVKCLHFQDKYCEVEMANKNDEWKKNIASIIRNTGQIESGKPAILLLDEIQNFRTKDEHGEELLDCEMKDVWTLLSDGKLAFKADLDNLLALLWSYEKKESHAASEGMKKEIRKGFVKTPSKKLKKAKKKVIPSDLFSDDDERSPSYYELTHFKSCLRLSEPIQEIAKWTDKQRKEAILKKLQDKSIFEEEDFTKCLIFISGNIDEAYGFTTSAEEVDIEADILHEKSKKITLLDIKAALGKRFRPEQISRFGNNHIIYPTLSKAAFESIINRKIASISERVEKETGVTMSFDQSILKLVYNNGVFPTQGTRPVFSTISEIVETPIPDFLLQALLSDSNSISLSYDGNNIIANYKKNIAKKTYVGKLDTVRNFKHNNLDRKALVCVHEAAHAIAHAILFKTSPCQIVANPASDEMEGFVFPPLMIETKESIIDRAVASLAGQEAEKIIFGDANQTSGSSSDIRRATVFIATMIRRLGMRGWNGLVESEQETCLANNDLNSSNSIIDDELGKAREKAKYILTKNMDFLLATVDELYNHDKISPEDFQKIAEKFGYAINIATNQNLVYIPFNNMLNDFKAKREASKDKNNENS
jgi:cell division protease FtsH